LSVVVWLFLVKIDAQEIDDKKKFYIKLSIFFNVNKVKIAIIYRTSMVSWTDEKDMYKSPIPIIQSKFP
jgi:hypothetical protein